MTSRKTVVIIALFAALLTACAGPDSPEPAATAQPSVTSPPAPVNGEAMRLAYEAVLGIVYYEHILPDGQALDWDGSYDGTGNLFAVCDVDFDGYDELIIEYNTGAEAGKTEVIYAFDSETGWVNEEFMQFPSLTYYDNGIIKAEFSHNQGLAGRFWPYFLYEYNAGLDIYECVAMADAWDGSIHGENYDGRPFPGEIDVSGEGIVYYLLGPDDRQLGQPVDKSEYEQWLSGYIGGAREMELPKIPLGPENFAEGAGGTAQLWLELDGRAERNYYADQTSLSKAQVERFALEVRRSVLECDWQALSQYCLFPLSLGGVPCPDADAFLSAAPELLTDEDFVAALTAETCEEMSFNSRGILMAGGRLVLGEAGTDGGGFRLLVTAIDAK